MFLQINIFRVVHIELGHFPCTEDGSVFRSNIKLIQQKKNGKIM